MIKTKMKLSWDIVIIHTNTLEEGIIATSDNLGDANFIAETLGKTPSYSVGRRCEVRKRYTEIVNQKRELEAEELRKERANLEQGRTRYSPEEIEAWDYDLTRRENLNQKR